MKAKLIKLDNGWVLMIDNIMYATDNDKLSIKNCQAIERGYDLDELLKKEMANVKLHPNDGAKKEGIERGIQIALEIFCDKKFSEEDMKYFAGFAIGYTKNGIQPDTESVLDNKLKSLQQTEWEVEIVTFTEDDLKSVSEDWGKLGKPKLDTDGCLILKTFKSE